MSNWFTWLNEERGRDISKCYLDENLYAIDQMAYEYLMEIEDAHANNFNCFYKQGLTKVADANKVSPVYLGEIMEVLNEYSSPFLANRFYFPKKRNNCCFYEPDEL